MIMETNPLGNSDFSTITGLSTRVLCHNYISVYLFYKPQEIGYTYVRITLQWQPIFKIAF